MLHKPDGGIPAELISPNPGFPQSDLADPNRLGKVGRSPSCDKASEADRWLWKARDTTA